MEILLLSDGARIPTKASEQAAGFDLYVPNDTKIVPGRNIIALDLSVALGRGYEGQIRPRSGFSAKGFEGVSVKDYLDGSLAPQRFNADVLVGTLDSDYRGVLGVLVKSNEKEPFVVLKGTRIAQLVIERCWQGEWTVTYKLNETDRGEGGFGSTGTH